ncbi:MAG: hypothetical protein ACYTGV_17510 [Planctomycetota bacterium]|jgi:hypothetical protein
MKQIVTLSLLVLLAAGCSSKSKPSEPFLTPEQEARLKKLIIHRLNALPDNIKLSPAQIESARPIIRMHSQALFDAAAQYRADPTPDNLRRFSNKGYEIQQQMRKDLKPLMTSAQLYNFLTVYDQTLQDVRAMKNE